MRAIVASKPGGSEVLEIVETAEPEVRDGEVKIRVHAFGLNKAESYYRSGNYGIVSPELALGYEAVGEVAEDPSGRMYRFKSPSAIPLAAAALTILFWAGPVAAQSAEPAPNPHTTERPPSSRTHLSLSTQFVEIVGLSPSAHHTAAQLSVGLAVAHILSPRWTLIGGLSLVTGIDAISLGGSATLAADYQLYRKESLRFGVGPNLTVVHSLVKMGAAGWGHVTVVGPGAGLTLGYRGATLNLGLGIGYTPQFGGWSLAPRVGVGASF